jgi:hypothetical protein
MTALRLLHFPTSGPNNLFHLLLVAPVFQHEFCGDFLLRLVRIRLKALGMQVLLQLLHQVAVE